MDTKNFTHEHKKDGTIKITNKKTGKSTHTDSYNPGVQYAIARAEKALGE